MSQPKLAFDLGAWFTEHADEVRADLDRYFDGAENNRFTGRWFEPLAANSEPNRFGPWDLVAVEALSVQVPPEAAARLLLDRASALDELLGQIPANVDLWATPRSTIEPGGPADEMHARLTSMDGIGWVTAGKLMAAKRPQLIPVYDAKVRELLNPDDVPFWETMHDALSEEEARSAIEAACASAPRNVSLLRRIDVALWMAATQRPPA